MGGHLPPQHWGGQGQLELGLGESTRNLGAAQGGPRTGGCSQRVGGLGRWGPERTLPPPCTELTYQEVLSFKPPEPPQPLGSLDVEQ